MNPDEYISKLTRLDELMGIDPDPETSAGKELSALADELQEYEQATFPNLYPPDDEPPEDYPQ